MVPFMVRNLPELEATTSSSSQSRHYTTSLLCTAMTHRCLTPCHLELTVRPSLAALHTSMHAVDRTPASPWYLRTGGG
jgi:hypothetical protein